MPYVRKRYIRKRRAPRPYRKVYKRKGYAKRATIRTNVKKNLYFFKRKQAPGRQINLTTDPTGQISFTLSQVPGSADFTALFDQYQIAGVKVDFRLILDPSSAGVFNSTYPNLYVRRDYDNTAVETVQEIAQDNRSKRIILQPNRIRSIYIKPALQNEYFNTATGLTDKSPVWNRWMDCSNAGMTYLGLKWAVDTMGVTMPNGNTMTIEYTFYLKMKNTR